MRVYFITLFFALLNVFLYYQLKHFMVNFIIDMEAELRNKAFKYLEREFIKIEAYIKEEISKEIKVEVRAELKYYQKGKYSLVLSSISIILA